ncbi:MAG: GLPGLI family protein [Bacteroidota bacterium]
MKKHILFVLLFVWVSIAVKAQQADVAVAAVHYTFLYVADTTDPSDITTDDMVLYIGKRSSVFKSYDRILRDSALQSQVMMAKMAMESGGPVRIGVPAGMRPGSTTSYYKGLAEGKLQQVENFIKNYVIEEKIPEINWNILSETKTIEGLSCQKATSFFRGRNYTVWFCSQLPYNNGPWKLGGLPGLIVEASDDKKEVVFRFGGYEELNSAKQVQIALPANSINATAKEYAQLREAARKDPQGFLNSSMGGSGLAAANVSSLKITKELNMNSDTIKRKQMNNPIEKSDN